MENPKPNKLKIPLLILGLFIILGGGGFAIWSVMKKEDEPTPTQRTGEVATPPPVVGRTNATNLYTAEELAHTALGAKPTAENMPQYTAVLMTSKEGLGLIEDRMRKIQLNKSDADKIRAKHLVGRTLVNNTAFSAKANQAISKMFSLVSGVVEGQYLTYPVYGKFETEATALRQDIDSFLAKDGQGYNLSEKRHGGNAWWFGSVGLNLMYGNTNATLHTADQIWWYKADRGGLDFFKAVNGHDVEDQLLLKKVNGKGVFAAWGIYKLVQIWREQMDFFDKVTREEAITALEQEGLIKRI
jgi:hypothetical protein